MSHFFLLSQVNPGDNGLLVLGVSPGLCGFRGWPDQKTLGGWQLGSVGCSRQHVVDRGTALTKAR